MDKQKELRKLKNIIKKIVEEYSPEKIILFGSWAWGKSSHDSDVDLFIIKRSKKQRIDRQRELRMKLFPPGMPLDLLVYTPKEIERRLRIGDFFIRDIINKGKLLYAAPK